MTDNKRGIDRDGPHGPAAEEAVLDRTRIVRGDQPAWPRYRNWLDKAPAPQPNRHSAITRSLYSWANYKSWADKVRSDWDKDE
jgi:hypothetical protein